MTTPTATPVNLVWLSTDGLHAITHDTANGGFDYTLWINADSMRSESFQVLPCVRSLPESAMRISCYTTLRKAVNASNKVSR